MRRYALRDDQWERIRDLLPGREGHVGVTAKDNRLFVEAVLYRYRAGVWLRDVLCTLDHEHRPREGARVERWAAADVGEALVLPQPRADDLPGRAPAQHVLAAGVVGAVEALEQPLQVAVAGH